MSDRDKIAALRAEADALEEKLRVFEAMPEDERLAITLHEMLCRWNHTDGCGWEYEGKNGIPDWHGHAHGKYLGKARMILSCCKRLNIKAADVIEIIKIAEE